MPLHPRIAAMLEQMAATGRNALSAGTSPEARQSRHDAAAPRRGTAARVPLGRLGTTEDVAALMLFLLSDDAAFAIGAAYTVDGGVMAGLPG